MGRILRWFFLFLAALVLTAIFEPPLMSLFGSWGWHSRPEQVAGDFLNWLAALTGDTAFPWVAAGILGVAMGVLLHFIATRFDANRPSKDDKFASLSYMISNVRDEIFHGTKNSFGEEPFGTKNRKIDLRLKALYSELRSLGLQPPNYDNYSGRTFYIGHYSYLQTLEPFAERGNLREAKRQGKAATAEFRAAVLKSQHHPESGT